CGSRLCASARALSEASGGDDRWRSCTCMYHRMKTHSDTPSVSAVPNSDHQRLPASDPFGKRSSPSGKIVGMKISSDIQIRSVSCMEANSSRKPLAAWQGCYAASGLTCQGSRYKVGQHHKDRHGGQRQKEDVTPQKPGLHATQPAADAVAHI